MRNDPDVVRALLLTPGTWAVVGLSENRSRAAYGVARFLRGQLGMAVVPVHPAASPVFGDPAYARLADIPTGTRIDVVDCFVNSARVGAVVDEALEHRERLGIRAVWLQLGVIDAAAAGRARAGGLRVVLDACPRIEYPKLAAAS